MASSSLSNEVLKAKKRLLDLENEVEVFERRLREMTEQTKQSIDQLSIDCDSNCLKVWREFDVLIEMARQKAGELCDHMKRKTIDQQSKWRLSLQEKENILVAVGMWRNDLNHLLLADNDDDDVFRTFQTEGAKLSSRLHELSTPVEEGHFVVTYPDWCHRSLTELRAEMVDFAIRTLPPRNLELLRECRLQDSNLQISSIASSDEDGHVFIVDWGDNLIKVFDESGEFIGRCPFSRREKFLLHEICRLSKDIFVVCGSSGSGSQRVGGLLFVAHKKVPPFLKKEKLIITKEKPFSSLCQMGKNIFVCDFDFQEIFCFSNEGDKIKTIKIGGWPGSGHLSPPVLCADPTTENLWVTGRGLSEIIVFNQNGNIMKKIETENEILDFRGDGFGRFYFCNEEGIFLVLPEKAFYKFLKKSESIPKIFFSQQKLFFCFKNDGEILINFVFL